MEADETGAALLTLLALVAGRELAVVLVPLVAPVLGPTLEAAFPPQAASNSDAAASVGIRGLWIIDSSALA